MARWIPLLAPVRVARDRGGRSPPGRSLLTWWRTRRPARTARVAAPTCVRRACTRQVTEWRRLRDAGVLEGKAPGEKVGRPSPEQAEIAKLTRELDLARRRLSKTEAALDIMGKARALLDEISESADTDSRPFKRCLLYTSPSPRDGLLSRMPSSA